MNTFVYVLLISAGTFVNFSIQNEIYGEELFLTIFGFEPMPDCEFCITQNTENDENDTDDLSDAIKEEIAVLVSDQIEDYRWLVYHERCGLYLGFSSAALFLLILACLKCRRRKQTEERTIKCKRAILPEKDGAVSSYRECFATGDRLRKTRKKRQHVISRQGLVILKKMREFPESSKTIDIIRQDTCKLFSMEQELSSGKMRVYDLRDRQAIPENVMDVLLCVKPNCIQHCHKSIRKYGSKIVCDLDKIPTECKNPHYGPLESICGHHQENILDNAGYSSDLETNQYSPLLTDDVNRYDEFGPPCASSSFISNESSMSIVFNHKESDPFRFLDEPSTPQTSFLQKYAETSITWFGELDLNQSISHGLEELDKSLDVGEINKQLPLYGFEAGSFFNVVVLFLIKQGIRKLKDMISAGNVKPGEEERLCQNTQHGNEPEADGVPVYNAQSNESSL